LIKTGLQLGMKHKIIWFILPKICKFLVKQGYHHQQNIERYYSIMSKAIDEQFTEDNAMTRDKFSSDCYKKSLRSLTFDLHMQDFS
jgi:hypothetical protein